LSFPHKSVILTSKHSSRNYVSPEAFLGSLMMCTHDSTFDFMRVLLRGTTLAYTLYVVLHPTLLEMLHTFVYIGLVHCDKDVNYTLKGSFKPFLLFLLICTSTFRCDIKKLFINLLISILAHLSEVSYSWVTNGRRPGNIIL